MPRSDKPVDDEEIPAKRPKLVDVESDDSDDSDDDFAVQLLEGKSTKFSLRISIDFICYIMLLLRI